MNDPYYREWNVTIYCTVTAPSYDEALASLQRSGIIVGALVGETLIDEYEVEGE